MDEKRNDVLLKCTKIIILKKTYHKSIDIGSKIENVEKCLKKDRELQNFYNKLQKILEKKQGYGIIKIQLRG
ncbi:MAG: hypothetical protein K2O91_08165 [Lachnospiraceae bacterium]|nr:hypothetical protein [Lachnospiraceae bacterium]